MKRVSQPLSGRAYRCAILPALLVATGAVQAEQSLQSADKPELDTVVVTGTLSETLIEDSPVPVQVISRDAIESSQAATLEDLLADVPGIQLIQTHGQTGSSIMLGGMGEKHVLVLVDGVPLNQANRSNIDTRSIRLANVERIEIVVANASSLYGSAAMGGVVQLITRQAEEPGYEIGIRTRQAEASTDRGPTRTDVDGRLVTPFVGGQLASTASLSYDLGFDRTPDSWEDQSASGLSWSLDERWDLRGDVNHSLGLGWSGWDLSQPGEHAVTGNPNENSVFEQHLTGQYHVKSDQAEIILAGGLGRGVSEQDKMATEEVDLTRTYESWDASIDSRLFFSWASRDQVVGARLGAAYLGQTKEELGQADVEEIEPADQQSVEVYVQDDWFVGERVEIVTGLRGHWEDSYGLHWAPNLATRLDLSEQQFIRASVGLGYRVPDLKERFYLFDHSLHGYRVIGNPDLEPETSLSAQAEWVAGPASVEIFVRDVKNLISTREVSSSGGITDYQYSNVEEADIWGINLGLDGSWKSHSLSAEFQWLYAEDSLTGERLARRPEYHLGLNHQWQFSTFNPHRLNTRLTHTGPQFYAAEESQPVDPYTLVDVSLATELTPAITLTIGVDNLTDVWSETTRNQDPLPITGREYLVGVRYAPQ